jgi:drug/metabolite transporter (DMT)-like permease
VLLVFVTAVWGWTFVVVKDAIAHYPVISFLAVRFVLATLVLWIIVLALRLRIRRAVIGLAIGLVLALSYLFQTLGLHGTSVANTGLITGLFVVFTPILDRIIFGVATRRATWLAAATAFAGTALLTGGAPTGLHQGDVLVLLAAVGLAFHITLLSRYASAGPLMLAAWQMTAAGLFFAAGAGIRLAGPRHHRDLRLGGCLLGPNLRAAAAARRADGIDPDHGTGLHRLFRLSPGR